MPEERSCETCGLQDDRLCPPKCPYRSKPKPDKMPLKVPWTPEVQKQLDADQKWHDIKLVALRSLYEYKLDQKSREMKLRLKQSADEAADILKAELAKAREKEAEWLEWFKNDSISQKNMSRARITLTAHQNDITRSLTAALRKVENE